MSREEKLLNDIIEKTRNQEIKWSQKNGPNVKSDFKKHPYEAAWEGKKMKIGTSGRFVLLNIHNECGLLEIRGWGICKDLKKMVEILFDIIQMQEISNQKEKIMEILMFRRREKSL